MKDSRVMVQCTFLHFSSNSWWHTMAGRELWDGKVKEENTLHYECARPHELPKVISRTMLRCYVFFMRLCQFPLFSLSLSLFFILQVNLWLQFSRFGSIACLGWPTAGVEIEIKSEEKMQRSREFFLLNHSFRTLISHWTFFLHISLLWIQF